MATIDKMSILSSNTRTEGIFVVSDVTLTPFKDMSKGSFLTFDIKDKTGQLPVKVWNDADPYHRILKTGKVFYIQGKINQYKGQNQLIASSIKKAEKYNPTDFLPASRRDPEEMWAELVGLMDENVVEKYMRELWEKYKNNKKFVQKFKMCPGGKGLVHHAYIHGLLEHTLCVLKMCVSYCKIYYIDSSTICMGAFLHDHGKLVAYTYDLSIEMTDIGRLHSHLNLSYTYAVPIINALDAPPEKREHMKLILGHLILSHHGTLEMGAAILPQTQEAILLSKADITDSEFNLSVIHTDKITEGHWSNYDKLKGKYYYKEA